MFGCYFLTFLNFILFYDFFLCNMSIFSTLCGGLNVSYRLIYLSTWSPGDGAVWEGDRTISSPLSASHVQTQCDLCFFTITDSIPREL